MTLTRQRARAAPRPVCVVWQQTPASAFEIAQTARDVVQTVLAETQRRLDAPELIGVRSARAVATTQSSEPLSFLLADETIVTLEWADLRGENLRVVTNTGRVLEVKTRARRNVSSNFADVEQPKPRKKPRVMSRAGARHRIRLDPTLGLEELVGTPLWLPGSKGAVVAIIERDPAGNAIGCSRLSGEDRNETLATQVEGLISCEQRHDELRYRYLILAVDMSGTRPVRSDPNIPFAPGTAERDDMVYVDRFIQEGWVENIVWFSDDRIARKNLSFQILLDRWQQNDIGLWLVDRGGKIKQDDELLVNMMGVLTANDRARTVQRLRTGALRKGFLVGFGHISSTPHAFMRLETNEVVPDPEIWPYMRMMFNLADEGIADHGAALSAAEVARQLTAAGYEIDHDRVRVLLKDPIYATGEWSVNLGTVKVPQKAIKIDDPVPLDQWQRVQDWLTLRGGGSKNTPLGEFLFNYVDCIHTQCASEYGGVQNRKIRIRGYVVPQHKDKSRRFRHFPVTPSCCKGKGNGKGGGWDWYRDLLEPPVVAELRKLVEHPEILRQLMEAQRHEVIRTSSRLKPELRREIEAQIDALEQQREAATDRLIESLAPGQQLDYDQHAEIQRGFTKRINALRNRLEADEAMARAENHGRLDVGPSYADRANAFLEILTAETPTDERMKALRARLFSLIVDQIEIDDDGIGEITIIIKGPLLPPDSSIDVGHPLLAGGDLLDRYVRDQSGTKGEEDRVVDLTQKIETDLEQSGFKSVSMILPDLARLPPYKEWKKLQTRAIDNRTWNRGWKPDRPTEPNHSWVLSIRISGEAVMAGSMRLTDGERLVLDMLRPGVIASQTELYAAGLREGLKSVAVCAALNQLADRGWAMSARASGPNGVTRIWCLSPRGLQLIGVDGGNANAEIPATEVHLLDLPRRAPAPSPSSTLLEIGLLSGDPRFEGLSDHAIKQKCQRINRRLRVIQRAFEASLSVPDALECLGQAPPEILDRVAAADLVALVMTDGSVGFPTWQFSGGFQVRSDLRPILAYASNAGFTQWALHLLLTKPMRHRGGTTFAAELHQQAIGEDRGELLNEIMAATVEAAEQSAELRRRRGTRTR